MYGLDRVDFSESTGVAVSDADRCDALGWGQAIFEDASAPMRHFLRFGWRILRLRLSPPGSPGHVLGWPVASATEERAVLATTSGLGVDVQLVIERTQDRVSFSTLIRYARRRGAVAWALVVPLHRFLIGRLLRRAADQVCTRQNG